MSKCPLCKGVKLQKIFEAKNAFVSVGDLATQNYDALNGGGGVYNPHSYCKGDLKLEVMQCLDCSYVYNALFDREKMHKAYSGKSYITPRAISNTMSSHIAKLSTKIKSYSLGVGLEIAPGSCDLVQALAGDFDFFYTIDPSYTPQELLKNERNICHIQSLFDYEKISNALKHKIDFIIFRHLIEHIDTPKDFLKDVVRLVKDGGMIYIETPNAKEIFESLRFYEIRHEHCGYWDLVALNNVLADLGCELVESVEFYDGQWIGLFFKKTGQRTQKRPMIIYDENLTLKLNAQIEKLHQLLEPYENIAIYGAGGHANSLLSYLDEKTCLKIKMAIDKDERRIGTYLQFQYFN